MRRTRPVHHAHQTAWSLVVALCSLAAAANPVSNPNESDIVAWGNRQILTRPVVAISAGDGQTIALQDDGSAVAFGLFGWTSIPANLPPLTSVRTGGASANYVGITYDSTLVGWGRDSSMLIPLRSLTKVVDVGFDSWSVLALKADGSLVESGLFGMSTLPSPTDVKAIAVGYGASLALKRDGSVVNLHPTDSSSNPPKGLGKAKAIATGFRHCVALLENGDIVAWGDSSNDALRIPSGLKNVVAIRAGGYNTAALLADSTVVVWGSTQDGMTTLPSGLRGVKSFAMGFGHIAALTSDGRIVVWGGGTAKEAYERVPYGSLGARALGGGKQSMSVVKADGSVIRWGGSDEGDAPAGLTGIKFLSQNLYHSIALLEDGTAISWGTEKFGFRYPVNGVKAVSAGYRFSVAVMNDGTVEAAGENEKGAIDIPSDLPKAKDIAAGWYHNLILTENDTVAAWGDTTCGATRVPKGLKHVKAIAAGAQHSLALLEDGTVVGWGDTTYGAAKVPQGLNHVKAIAAGPIHSIALKEDGTVVAWGDNSSYQTTVPNNLPKVKAIFGGFDCTMAILDRESGPAAISDQHQILSTLEARAYPAVFRDLRGNRIGTGDAHWTGTGWRTDFRPARAWILQARTPLGLRTATMVRP